MKIKASFFLLSLLLLNTTSCFCWGFFAHRKINYYSVFLLPPEMMVLYKPYAEFLMEHAVDPDKRRYIVATEGPRHYIDIDHYGMYPYDSLPRKWNDAVAKYSEDSLYAHGIVPWWIQTMLYRLTEAFKEKNQAKILKYSAEIGHYIADAHVPLHASSNHNGQYTDQRGIHGFWESRIPELLADKEWDFFIGKAEYINNPPDFTWKRVLESAAAADTVLRFEKELSKTFPSDQKFAFEERNGVTIRQYSSAYSKKYNENMKGMVERRMRQSIFAIASFWYTAWVNAGQPNLTQLSNREFSAEDLKEFEELNAAWKSSSTKGREHE
ncbi:MAG: S1/P1 Nuclease [Chitinophagaceae bacterium]|nr:S1/P1 Nuclease [Chitinophagaceae bacterium]